MIKSDLQKEEFNMFCGSRLVKVYDGREHNIISIISELISYRKRSSQELFLVNSKPIHLSASSILMCTSVSRWYLQLNFANINVLKLSQIATSL